MSSTMKYKDYIGSVEYSEEDSCLYGKIIGINDLVTYEGQSVQELREAFQGAVDDYLDMCERYGKTPEKTYKGSFNVRIDPQLHREAAFYAQSHGKTLNSFVEDAIQRALR